MLPRTYMAVTASQVDYSGVRNDVSAKRHGGKLGLDLCPLRCSSPRFADVLARKLRIEQDQYHCFRLACNAVQHPTGHM